MARDPVAGRDRSSHSPSELSGETHSGPPSSSRDEPVGEEAGQLALNDTIGRRYLVRRLLGQGGMGRVYLGRDITLGRSVALKVVRSGAVGVSQAARILNEARVIATLNHPHILQLYDVGEHADSLYLALEYVDGDTLQARLAQAPPSVDEALRHVRAIADALAHAHAHGVYHCDLKPGNVMVGRDGRLRVVDFGIAQTAGVTAGHIGGTPEWMAPEQASGEEISDRVDIWALGILAAELLTGRHPFRVRTETAPGTQGAQSAVLRPVPEVRPAPGVRLAPEVRPIPEVRLSGNGIPGVISELIARSLQRAPRARPSAQDWLRALDEVVVGRGDSFTEEGPYRGLSSFDEPYARFFFGREADVDAFLERLRDTPCLPIVGPSGVGKSSFLHAGVIPRLRARERWTVLAFRPGAEPIAALARQVLLASEARALPEAQLKVEVAALEQQLHDMPTHLAVRLVTCAAACGSRVLLAIDQLEEVFTQGASEAVRQRFLAMILAAADDAQDPVRVAFTMRDDFLGRIPQLRSLFVMRRMSMDELRRTIVGPLQRTGYRFDDPAVVDEMLAEVNKSDLADLPLVQFACRALWDGRDVESRVLRRATYLELGGISGALGRHAEAALAQLSAAEHRSARQLLLQLVGGTTRRSLPRPQLLAAAPEGEAVLDRLLAARLLVQRTPEESDEPIVEIAHESLLISWPQLVRWLEETRDERRLLAELQDATSLWERRGRRDEETWSVGDLEAARHRAAQLDLTLPPRVEEFLSAAAQRHRRQRRKRFTIGASGTVAIGVAAAAAVLLVGQSQLRERKARGNFGRIELRMHPFDYREGGTTSAVDAVELPKLHWTLYAADPKNGHEPGEPMPVEVVKIEKCGELDGAHVDRVEAPGGAVFLKIEHRGRNGETCAPSWIRLSSLPGYSMAAQGNLPRIDIDVPTCQASRWGMVEIPAGPFFFGGQSVPKVEGVEAADYTAPIAQVELPAFWIDRTEVSNAAFEPFARMAALTGYPKPTYSSGNDAKHRHDGDGDRPVTSVDSFEAEAFCRYLGKTLPSDHQWVKALRGGLVIDSQYNPAPWRLFPWGAEDKPSCANLQGEADGFPWVAPVDAMPCDVSPYGVLQLGGNVEEWISREGQLDPENPLRAMRGGAPDSPPELWHHTAVFRNHREDRYHDYAVGLRCADEGSLNRK